jgi:hypothetical protein
MACCASIESSHQRTSRRRWTGRQCPDSDVNNVPRQAISSIFWKFSYIATGEVTTLKHELWNDTVELGANVALTFLGGLAELLEVLRGLRDDVVVELEIDAAGLFWK